MTRERRLREVLNVRLDEPLAQELRRLAATHGQTESEVARWLLGYGVEVSRRLEAARISEPFSWRRTSSDPLDERPGIVEIEARWREMTDRELAERGLHEWLSSEEEDLEP
jgi:hypothetical protein